MLKEHGVKKGDRVAIYMPMIPEAAYAMLACARIGAVHSVVFGGFSPDACADRIDDCRRQARRHRRRGPARRQARCRSRTMSTRRCEGRPAVETCWWCAAPATTVPWRPGRDVWLHEALASVAADCPPEPMNAEDPLFILYTSGSTGKPKGVLHTTGGYLVCAAITHEYVFDYHDGDIYWCTADVGWVTGHSYIVYGPLANGATTLMFEGMPTYPDAAPLLAGHRQAQGQHLLHRADGHPRADGRGRRARSKRPRAQSLRLLGSVGEPINPEAWHWYHRVVGKERCPIVDTWWQTETGGIMITPLPGAIATKPGSATLPFFGVQPVLVDDEGKLLEGAGAGRPRASRTAGPARCAPSIGDHERFVQTYFSDYKGNYFTGDGCRRDEDGYYWITGRVDDVHQRLRPPHRHRRSRKRAGRASEGRRGRRRRLPARHQGPGHLLPTSR